MNTQSKTEGSSDLTWIALAHVMSRAGTDLLDGARGAYVNAVGLASSSANFEMQLRESLVELGFEVVEIDDLELLSERQTKEGPSEELIELAKLSVDGEIKFGSFHTYDDADDLM